MPYEFSDVSIGVDLGLVSNSQYILNTYYVPDTFLSDLHVLSHLILTTTGLLNGLGSVRFKAGDNFSLS